MLTDMHPIVRALDALPYPCTLVGSRGLGLHSAHSDYDYLMARPEGYPPFKEAREALIALGFTMPKGGAGYGDDPSADVFTYKVHTTHPPVDVIVVTEKEYERRLRVIKILREAASDVKTVGSLYRGLKEYKSWPLFWALIRKLELKT